MTALGKLFRTTAFKLSLVYLAIFAIGAGLVIGRLGWTVNDLINEQIRQTVEMETQDLTEQYNNGGLRRLVNVINRRDKQPGSSLYLVTNFQGVPIIGNVAALPQSIVGQHGIFETSYQRVGDSDERHLAMARIFLLDSGFRMLVGRDLDERERVRGIVVHALVTSLLYVGVFGLIGGLFVASRVLRRIDGMTATTQRIMAGDLSGRVPVLGTGDELDRLAHKLNEMLERISELLTGLKEVTDNIAHDLKTPLTRLRNRAEQALRAARDPAQDRQALESIIEESDGLIGIFNALLMIARVEAGSGREIMSDFDVGDAVRDVAELYEPVAEEAGANLTMSIEPDCRIHGNRELIGQAIVNLIDNALKYGVPPDGGGRDLDSVVVPISPQARAADADIDISIAVRRVDGTVEISVADRGRGIAAADRARACERFVRLEGSRSRPGSGLGLSLVSAIAHLHAGTLRLEDHEPGLRVVVAIPQVEPVAARRRLPAPTGAAA